MKIKDIVKIVEGKLLNANENFFEEKIDGIKTLEEATERDISFLYSIKFLKKAKESKAKVIIIPDELSEKVSFPAISVKNPRMQVLKLVKIFYKNEKKEPFISNNAIISPTAKIGKNVYIGHFVVVEDNVEIGDNTYIESHCFIGKNVKIGKNCCLYPGVKIYSNCILKDNVILHSNVVIGSDGFGYIQDKGKNIKIPQVARVVIENDVEIGACTTIDRGFLTDTVIGENTKIDNQVQIGHNVKIGKSCIIVAKCGIAGSVKIGDNVIMGGFVAIRDNVKIGNRVGIPALTVIGKDVSDDVILEPEPFKIIRIERRLRFLEKKINK